jgi:release factor glutamine methyltransferase
MTIQSAQQALLVQLKSLYDEREAANICDWVMEHLTGKKRIGRLLDKQEILPDELLAKLDHLTQELNTHRPVQYVLGEAWFAGMKFYVNEHVLIPRPETEELVEWIVEESQKSKAKIENILDIGTGSGCIPIALQKRLPGLSVTSVDISKEALEVAGQNAQILGVDISLLNIDFLNENNWDQLPVVDIIVSNPPYIKQSESSSMAKNVLDFEPGIALFVPDEDALLFYRKIADFAKTHLSEKGSIFLEINEKLGKEVITLFEYKGYYVELRKDLQGRDRMVSVFKHLGR